LEQNQLKIGFFTLFFLFAIFFTISGGRSHFSSYLQPVNSPLTADNDCDQNLPFLAENAESESDSDDDFAELHFVSPLLHAAQVVRLAFCNQIGIIKHSKICRIRPRSPPSIIL
jgi:hypothetical protein